MHINKYLTPEGYQSQDGSIYSTPAEFIVGGILGFCICNNYKASLAYIYPILKLIDHQDYEQLNNRFSSEGEKVTMYYLLAALGITEHATFLPGWLSKEGKELLEDLDIVMPTIAV